ncbi:MAG: hypothetical protein RMY62_007405 [Nostoc sp. ZfuVER08]|uniref:Uncharacterized protein n=1 Tax=Nostoc punctiforme FACHB-252 TaxID=1357509 RepID=A0ABR8HJK4_NOSPU|nr:hypothetical protein [Nostoc punctiforme]MBD2615280.1 hypothetical protein [Nostoc punctiforme FACHB-252]MBL1200845.1 hypothetical protein [Nostoc sp. GBBB01]MDZ8010784.1 hypothetical protein [Nostoc sp. ZfuVER08]
MVELSHSFTQIKSGLYYQNSRENSKKAEQLTDTWNYYLQSLHQAIAESNTAKEMTQKDYDRVQALAVAWEKEIQIALKNSCEDRIRQALACKQNYTARARELKTIVERHIIHLSILQTRLAYWQNQL